jgi:hypothetical protein
LLLRPRFAALGMDTSDRLAFRLNGVAKVRKAAQAVTGRENASMKRVKSAGAVVQEFKEDFIEAVEHMNALVAE